MRSRRLIPVLCFISIIIFLPRGVHAQLVSQDFLITPSAINIKLEKNFWGNDISVIPSVTLNVHGSTRNDTVVDVFADTFFEEKDRRPPFSSEAITFNTRQINQIEFLRVEIQVGFDLPSNLPPGLYRTKIYVTLSSGSTKSVPILLKVSASEWLMGGLILFGVILNLFLFFIKDMVDGRNNLREKVNRTDALMTGAYDSVTRAFNESRLDNLKPTSSYWLARVELEDLISDWNKAIESNALDNIFLRLDKITERAVSLADKAKAISEDIPPLSITAVGRLAPPINAFRARKKPEDRFKIGILRDSLIRSRNLQYFALALTFGIIVMNSWQTYLNEAIAFGASGLADYLAVILSGFGSQTVLTQGMGMARSWAEARAT